jgi:DNA-binding transcriptional LysR family regulator
VAIFGLPEGLDERLHTLPLYRERFGITFPPGHAFAAKNAVKSEELYGQPYCNRANCEYNDFARQQLVTREVVVKRVFRSEREDWVQAMIGAGLGFGFFPEFSVADPAIQWRPLVDPEFVRTVNLVTMRGRPHSPAVGALMREAKTHRWSTEAQLVHA